MRFIQFARALRSISESPPELSFNTLISQVANDVLAAEKLEAIGINR